LNLERPIFDAAAATLRAMTPADLSAAHALSTELRWPHRLADWEQALRHAEGIVAELDGSVAGTALCCRWGPRHATIGLVIVAPSCQGQGIGRQLTTTLLAGLSGCSVLLYATDAGRPLYERLGFVRSGELRQHQGIAPPGPLVALPTGWRLRPPGQNELATLQALDAGARGMPRDALIAALLGSAEATVILDRDGEARGFGMLRRFGRGHAIGPVVATDAEGAKAVIAHLAGLNAGKFTRIDIDAATGLGDWLEQLGLVRVDAPIEMVRGTPLVAAEGTRRFAIVTQALG
jgi:predicted N-acetyltransferase YhbS